MDFRIRGFKAADGTYLNAATTRTWQVRTERTPGGTVIANGDLTYITGSNGEYVATATPAEMEDLEEGTEYWLHVVLAEGGVQGDWEVPVTAQRRLGTRPTG